MLVYLNGQYLPKSEARLSVDDRGFVFGDGVYEVFRVVEGRVFEGERHEARLARGLKELEIGPPAEAAHGGWREIAARLLRENGHDRGQATIYLEITRGAAERTHYFPAAGCACTVYLATSPFKPLDALRATGARAITRPDVRWLRCDLKTIQLLPNVLAKQAAVAAGAYEAVLVREGGRPFVTEGSHSNVWIVTGGTLRTHPRSNLILAGVTRDVVLELAAGLGIPAREEAFTPAELLAAGEVFVTSTTGDVLPIVQVDATCIADGSPGPIARKLYAALIGRMKLGAR